MAIWLFCVGGGGWASAPDGPYAWGYCFVRETKMETYCDDKAPCPPGKKYYGRGPIQLTQYVSHACHL